MEKKYNERDSAQVLPNGKLGCYDCGSEYGGPKFPDLFIPFDVWNKISPSGNCGGLLCPVCINARLHELGEKNVFGRFVSGPMAVDPKPSEAIKLIEDCIHEASFLHHSDIHYKLCTALDIIAFNENKDKLGEQ